MARHRTYAERFPDNPAQVLHQEHKISGHYLFCFYPQKAETFEVFRVSPVSLNGSPLSDPYIVLMNVSVYFNNSSPDSCFAWS